MLRKIREKCTSIYEDFARKKILSSSRTVRIALFRFLPKATGHLKLYQDVNSKLLSELTTICEKNEISYWLCFASLIGAESRSSSIPWDDDIDVCMMREDFEKLTNILRNSEEFKINLVYDYYAKNKQYRFMSRDTSIYNFIDISICDWAKSFSSSLNNKYLKLCKDLEHDLEKCEKLSHWKKSGYLNADLTLYPKKERNTIKKNLEIAEMFFLKYHNMAYDKKIFCEKSKANAVAYSLDNWIENPGKDFFLWDRNIIFPIKRKRYDKIAAMIPRKGRKLCSLLYPNWPFIPDDTREREHISEAKLESDENVKNMERFLNEK